MLTATGVCEKCKKAFAYKSELGAGSQKRCTRCGGKPGEILPDIPEPVEHRERKKGPTFADIIASTYE